MSNLLTIESFLEALRHPEQCDVRLRNMRLDTQSNSSRGFRLDKKHIVFFLSDGTHGWTLTVPLRGRFEMPQRTIEARISEGAHLPFLTEAYYLPRALVICDRNGDAHPREGLLQRSHTPLTEFLRLNCSNSSRPLLRSALQNISWTMLEMLSHNLLHGALNRERITFDKRGALLLTDHPIVTPKGDDTEVLGECAVLLYIIGCQGDICRKLTTPITLKEHDKTLRHILASAEHHSIEPLVRLLYLLHSRASKESICKAVESLAEEPFRPMPLLKQLLATSQNEGLVEVVTEPPLNEDMCEKVDFDTCDELFQSDLMVRYRKGDIWGYAHYNGERIPTQRVLLAAYDFVEGRAVVRTRRGYGLIDSSGRMVMNDVWEDVVWHGEENIATACDDSGRWHIFDRMGRRLSAHSADWMGEASEGFIVARRGDKFGYFATDGQKRTDFIYDEAFSFFKGVALVCHKGVRYHINTSFHRLTAKEELKIENCGVP